MYQGTTPSVIYNIRNYDLTGAKVYVTFSRQNDILTKSGNDITIAYDDETKNTTVICPLTQEETLAMRQGAVKTQIRFIFSNGQAFATNIVALEVQNILFKEVIKYGGDD